MRGKDDNLDVTEVVGWITPAYAGKSAGVSACCALLWDHPRVCGEKDALSFVRANHQGSPPRVRGKVRRGHLQHAAHGITPAYAGKRPLTVCWRWQKRDHPRVCGEKMSTSTPLSGSRGSPPRVRGKGRFLPGDALRVGITPAYAGKRAKQRQGEAERWDHPRVCGEKSYSDKSTFSLVGSPPRMRGKEYACGNQNINHGITPAYAGKSR